MLKKHSPLLYTEKHGTLAPRNKSKDKNIPPAVFAISGKKSSAQVEKNTNNIITRWEKCQIVSLTYFQYKHLPLLYFLSAPLLLFLFLSFTLFPSFLLCVSSSVPLLNWCTLSLCSQIFIPHQHVFISTLISTFFAAICPTPPTH